MGLRTGNGHKVNGSFVEPKPENRQGEPADGGQGLQPENRGPASSENNGQRARTPTSSSPDAASRIKVRATSPGEGNRYGARGLAGLPPATPEEPSSTLPIEAVPSASPNSSSVAARTSAFRSRRIKLRTSNKWGSSANRGRGLVARFRISVFGRFCIPLPGLALATEQVVLPRVRDRCLAAPARRSS